MGKRPATNVVPQSACLARWLITWKQSQMGFKIRDTDSHWTRHSLYYTRSAIWPLRISFTPDYCIYNSLILSYPAFITLYR